MVALGQRCQILLQAVLADHVFHLRLFDTEHGLDQPVFNVAGEALVEPHVLPTGVGDQIARPAMRQLMRYQADQRAVADDHGGGGKGEAWILHATEREARRQHQQVVAAPAIRAIQRFGGLDHRFGIDELAGSSGQHRRFGPHPGAFGQRCKAQIAYRQRQQIRRDRLRHAEYIVAIACRSGVVIGTHQRDQAGRRTHMRAVGEAHRGRILQRHPTARMDRLRLAEQERMLAAGGHRRIQPLQARRLRRGAVADAHHFVRPAHRDAQLAAEDRIVGRQLELQPPPHTVAGLAQHFFDAQCAGIEHQHAMRRVEPAQAQIGTPGKFLFVEIHAQIKAEIGNPHLVRLGVRAGIVRVREQWRQQQQQRQGDTHGATPQGDRTSLTDMVTDHLTP